MLDLLLFRTESGGNPAVIRESQRRRGADASQVDRVLSLDAAWRRLHACAALHHKELAASRKAFAACRDPAARAEALRHARESLTALSERAAESEREERAAHAKLQECLLAVGNLVHEHAPLSPPAPQEDTPAALRTLLAAGYAQQTEDGWRPVGVGLSLSRALATRALAFAVRSGFSIVAAPLDPSADRLAKYTKLCRQRGEQRASDDQLAAELRAQPLGALHAASWLQPQELPLRYVFVGGGGEEEWQLRVLQVCADDHSCWRALEALCGAALALHRAAGIPAALDERAAPQLPPHDARAFSVRAAAAAGRVELARLGCQADYTARRFGVRCGLKQLGERTKRHVNTVSGCIFRADRCLMALASAAQGDVKLLDALATHLICTSMSE